METARQRSGRLAEEAVLAAATKRGFKLVARNYRTRYGELDLLLTDGATLIVTEVRYRSAAGYGLAVETVTRSKQTKIITATRDFLAKNRKWQKAPVRFDVVGVDVNGELNWIEQAFLGE